MRLNHYLPLGFVLHVWRVESFIPWAVWIDRSTWVTPEWVSAEVLKIWMGAANNEVTTRMWTDVEL